MGFDEKAPWLKDDVLDVGIDYQLVRFKKICLGIILVVAQHRSVVERF